MGLGEARTRHSRNLNTISVLVPSPNQIYVDNEYLKAREQLLDMGRFQMAVVKLSPPTELQRSTTSGSV